MLGPILLKLYSSPDKLLIDSGADLLLLLFYRHIAA